MQIVIDIILNKPAEHKEQSVNIYRNFRRAKKDTLLLQQGV